jgi:hypothetical protein
MNDEDWIVHLDEETQVLECSTLGIFKFTSQNTHPIGQGIVTYGKARVTNLLNTLADSTRVSYSCCTLFLTLKYFKTSFTHLNGSFLVLKKRVESEVSFDFGVEGRF